MAFLAYAKAQRRRKDVTAHHLTFSKNDFLASYSVVVLYQVLRVNKQ